MPNGRVTGYDPSTSRLSFVVKPETAGLNRLYVAIAGNGTRTYAGQGDQGLFVDSAGSTFVMPSAATVGGVGILVAGSESSIVVTTASDATDAQVEVFYGPVGSGPVGSEPVASGTLTAATLVRGSATVGVTIPAGTWTLFVRFTSPSGIRGPFIALSKGSTGLTVTSLVARVTSMKPTTVPASKATSVEFRVDGLPDCALSVYADAELVGTGPLVSGTARVSVVLASQAGEAGEASGAVKISVSPNGASGPFLEAGTLSVSTYTAPTSVTCSAGPAVAGTPFTVIPTFVPAVEPGTAVVVSTGAQGPKIGEGTAASVTCTVALAGTYTLYFTVGAAASSAVTLPSGSAPLVVRYVEPTELSLSSSSFVVGTITHATIVLRPAPSTTADRISATLGASASSVTGYDASTGVVSFDVTPSESGCLKLRAIVEYSNSTQQTSLSCDVFVDAAGSTFVMPSSFSFTFDGSAVSITTASFTQGSQAPFARVTVYYGPVGTTGATGTTGSSSPVACGLAVLDAATVRVPVSIPAGTWSISIRVTSPLGVEGPLILGNSTSSSVQSSGSTWTYQPWQPTGVAVAGVTTTSVPAPYKLVVGAAVSLRFAFDGNATGFPSTAASSFSITGLAALSVDGTSLVASFAATSATDHTFSFAGFGRTYEFVVRASEVFAAPAIETTTRDVALVTVGKQLTVSSRFASAWPTGSTATLALTPYGRAPETLSANCTDKSVVTSFIVKYDSAHAGTTRVSFGVASWEYSWALSDAEIYTFPSSVAYAGDATFTVAGGDGLVAVEYVEIGAVRVEQRRVSVSPVLATISVADFVPVTDVGVTVALRAPDGTVSALSCVATAVPTVWPAPTDLTVVLALNGATSGPDYNVAAFAANQTYTGAVTIAVAGRYTDTLTVGSVRVFVDDVLVPGCVASYTFADATVSIGLMTVAPVGKTQFVVTFVSISGATMPVSVAGPDVVSVPDAVSIATIGSGYSLVASHTVPTKFAFTTGGSPSTVDVAKIAMSSTATVALGSFVDGALGAMVYATAGEQSVTFTFATTRTRVSLVVPASAVYSFPETATCTVEPAVVTVGNGAKMVWVADSVPDSATVTATSPAATFTAYTGATGATGPLAFTIVPTSKRDVVVTLVVSFGGVSASFTRTALAASRVYSMPTGVRSSVRFAGTSVKADDASIGALAVNGTYGVDVGQGDTGARVCGEGNVSVINLALVGVDGKANVRSVSCVDSVSRVAYGTTPTFRYDEASSVATIGTYTLGATAPASGSVRFGVVVEAPDGQKSTLYTQSIQAVVDATRVTLGAIAGTIVLVSGSEVTVPATFDVATGASIYSNGTFSALSTDVVDAAFRATYFGDPKDTVLTFTVSPTRRRITATVGAAAILAWPASASTVAGPVTVGVPATVVTTMSSVIPSFLSVSVGNLVAADSSTLSTLGAATVSGAQVIYTLTAASDATFTADVTLRLGTFSRTYPQTLATAAQVFSWPTGIVVLSALLPSGLAAPTGPTGPTGSGQTALTALTALAAGTTYTDLRISVIGVDSSATSPSLTVDSVRAYVGSSVYNLDYTYADSTVSVPSMTIGSSGSLEFGVTVTAPSGSKRELRSTGQTVYATPTTVTIAPIASGYSLVAGHATATTLTFGLLGQESAAIAYDSVTVNSASVSLGASGASNPSVNATITAESAVEQKFTFTFEPTRATATLVIPASAIYTFPTLLRSSIVSDGSLGGPVVTLGYTATLGLTFDGVVPAGATHSVINAVSKTPTTSVIAAPVSVLEYTLTSTEQKDLVTKVTVWFGGASVEYSPVALLAANIFVMPTRLDATVKFTGSATSVSSDDASITALAVNSSYGPESPEGPSAVCGSGNASAIELVAFPAIAASGAVTVRGVDSVSLAAYGTMKASGIQIQKFTLGSAPSSGSVRFEAIVTGPDGRSTVVRSAQIAVVTDATSATFGEFASGLTLVAGSQVTVPVSFAPVTASAEVRSTGSFSAIDAVVAPGGTFKATYSGLASDATFTLVVAPTRRRITVVVPASAILVWPTSATTAPETVVTVGTASKLVTTLSSEVPSAVGATVGSLVASDSSTGSTVSSAMVSGTKVTYTLTAMTSASYTATLTLRAGPFTRAITQVLASSENMYSWPKGITATLALNGAITGADYDVRGFAAGRTYSGITIAIDGDAAVAATGAVRVCVSGVESGSVASYTYDSASRKLTIDSMVVSSVPGPMAFGVTVSSPSGATLELLSSEIHTVYVVPDAVTIAPIGTTGFVLVAGKPTPTKFTFTANGTPMISAVPSASMANGTITALTASNGTLDATVTVNSAQDTTITFTFATTRTTVAVSVAASQIYTFPVLVSRTVTSDGPRGGSVVTVGKSARVVAAFDGQIPKGAAVAVSAVSAVATVAAVTASTTELECTIVPGPTGSFDGILLKITVTFGVSVEYTVPAIAAASVFAMPSAVAATVAVIGSNDPADTVTALAVNTTYGTAGAAAIGITLSITGDPRTDVLPGAVSCVDSVSLQAYGNVPTFEYSGLSGLLVSVTSFTLGSAGAAAPSSGRVAFAVVVTAPDGNVTTLTTAPIDAVVDAQSVTLGELATGLTLVSGSEVSVPVVFDRAVYATVSSTGTFSALATSVAAGSFTATYTGAAKDTTFTFVLARTRRRIQATVAASSILVWPESATTAPVDGVTVGVASAIVTTLSAAVPAAVSAVVSTDSAVGAAGTVGSATVAGLTVSYALTASSNATYTATVTLSVGTTRSYTKAFAQTLATAAQVYAWPSGVTAVLSLNSASTGADYDVRGFAAGISYSGVVLTLLDVDQDTDNSAEVAPSGAVAVYVGGALVAGVVKSYAYDAATHTVTIGQITLGTETGSLRFGLTVTAPSGSKRELLSSGHTVFAVPDTVSIGTIGDGYSLIAGHATHARFAFSNTNAAIHANLGNFSSGTPVSSSLITLDTTATVTLASTFAESLTLVASVDPKAARDVSFAFMFSATRTTAVVTVPASAIYTFPALSSLVATSTGPERGTVVTINTEATLVATFDSAVPKGATHAVAVLGPGSVATITPLNSVLTDRTTSVQYTLVPTAKQDVGAKITLTFGAISVEYTATAIAASSVYVMPSGVTATVSFGGSGAVAADASIAALSVGASYGPSAQSVQQVCGEGNTSSIVLALTGCDTTSNESEIRSSAVTCVDSSTLAPYGSVPTYTYVSGSHSASIGTYTLGSAAPGSGSVRFAVTVTAPDGRTTTLRTAPISAVADATSASLGTFATGLVLLAGSVVTVPVTFAPVTPASAEVSTTGVTTGLVSSGSFDATYSSAPAADTTFTFIIMPTRRRISVVVPASAILVWPNSATTKPVGLMTAGTLAAMETTLGSVVPAAVSATLTGVTAGATVTSPTVNGQVVSFSLTAASSATYTATLVLRAGSFTRAYAQTLATAAQIYAWPSGVVAVVSLNAAALGSPDYDVRGLAAGRTYADEIKLTLQGTDGDTENKAEVAPTGAVSVYVGSAASAVSVAYKYDAATHTVTVSSMTLGTETGALQFGVTVTAPSGLTRELRSTGYTVYAVPNAVTIAEIDDGFALIKGKTTPTQFAFSNSNASIDANISITANDVSVECSEATVSIASSFATRMVIGGTVNLPSGSTQATIKFTFAPTRTTAVVLVPASAIYTFPTLFSCVATSTGPERGTVVTINTEATLVATFDSAVPKGGTHAVAVLDSSVATITPQTAVLTGRSTSVQYTLVPTAKQDVGIRIVLTFGTIGVEYTATAIAASSVYVMPSGVTATVSFGGSGAVASDSSIAALSVGASYGPQAQSGQVCGDGNTSSIVLALTGCDTTSNEAEIRASSVTCVDSSTLAPYGSVPTYTYVSGSHSASIGTYTLGSTAPSSASVRFAVIVTAPDGRTTTLRTAPISAVVDATSATLGYIDTGLVLISGSAVTVPVTFAPVTPASAEVSSPGLFSALDTAVSSGFFVATYAGSVATTFTFIIMPTRRRIAVAVPASAILVWPSVVSVSPVSGATATVGAATQWAMKLSAGVPSVVGAALSALTAADGHTGATIGQTSIAGDTVSFTLTATSNTTYTAKLRLSVKSFYKETTETIASATQVYTWPSGLVAVVSLNAATSGSADYDVLGLAAGKTYTGITLTLQGIDADTTNSTEVAATGAVKVYVNGAETSTVGTYAYDSTKHAVTVDSIAIGAVMGPIEFGLTVRSPSGATREIRTVAGHRVYAVPDTVTIASIAGGPYSLVAGKATQTQFTFGHSNSTIDDSLSLETGSSSSILTLTTTASASWEATFSANKVLNATVTASAADVIFTFLFSSTRTTAAVTVAAASIYTFPSVQLVSVVSSGTSGGSVVTLNQAATLTVTFGAALPFGATHVVSSANATYTLVTASPLATSTAAPQYTMTPTSKQDITPTIKVTFGNVEVTYSPTVLTSTAIYTFPTGLSSVVKFTGPTTVAQDDGSIGTLAVGAAYGTAAGSVVCGTGNTSSIVLTLTGYDATTTNNAEVSSAAISCVDSGTSTAYGTMGTYTYTAASHSVSIGTYTLGSVAPASGSLQFKVIVTAPDGYTTTLTAPAIPTAVDATTVALTPFATGLTLVSGSSVTVPVTFNVTPASASVSSTGTFTSLATSVSSNAFAATYSGVAASTTLTFIIMPTRRRLTATVAAAGILVWPDNIVSTTPATSGSVTVGTASARTTTLSSSVPSAVTVALSALAASDSSSGASLGAATVSGSTISYTLTANSNAAYTATITLSAGTFSKSYTSQTIATAAQVYSWPTASAVLALNGAFTGPDYNVLGFAAGRTYASSVTLTLQNLDADTANNTEVAATGAVRVYVNSTEVSGAVGSYAYSGHTVTLGSVNVGSNAGPLVFGVTVTAPSGVTREILTSGHTVYQVPDTVSIATIAGGDTYKLVAGKATTTQFTFSSSSSVSLPNWSSGSSSSLFTLTTAATASWDATFSANKVLGASVTATAVDTTFTFLFTSTRTTAAVTVLVANIYTFPAIQSVSVVSSGTSGGSVVTLTKPSTLTVTFGSALPIGASHTISSTGATYALITASTLAARTAAPQYTMTPTAKQDITPTITVTLGTIVVTYTPTALASTAIYTFPSGLSSVVKFTGPTTVAQDDGGIGTLAVGAAYGTAAGTVVCGSGNTSSIVLTLTGYDATTANTTEIKTAALSCVDSGTSTAYGTLGTYTYTAASHSVSIDTYTLGSSAPASGSLQFKVIVTAPDGYTSSLTASAIPTAVDATTVALTPFATGLTLVSGSSVTVPVTFNVTPASASVSSTGTFTSLATSVSSNAFVAAYSGAAASTTFTFIIMPTRRRLTATVAASSILVWPTISSTGPTGTVTMGTASAIATTLSSSVPAVVTAALSALTAADSSTGATLGALTISGSTVSYTLTPNANTTYTATLTLSAGSYTSVYTALTLATADQVYAWPTGVTALLALNGASTGSDYNVLGFAAGRTYSGAATPPSTITLTLTGIDPSPTNTTEVAATGAVRVYVGGILVAGAIGAGAYAYNSTSHTVTVTSMTLGTTTGTLAFGVTVTAPSGATMELKSSGQHQVYAVPDTVSVATIAGGDTYKLVATKATDTQFSFSNSNSTIDGNLGAFASGSTTSGLLTLATTATVNLGATLSASKVLSATVTVASAVDTTFTCTFVSTRTTAAVTVLAANIYTFPSVQSVSVVSSGTSGGSVVTLTKASTLTVTFGAALPIGATHVVSSTGATYALITASTLTSRTIAPQYTMTPIAKQDIVPTITVTLGTIVVTYTPTVLASTAIYTFPTGLTSTITFSGAGTTAQDESIAALAASSLYGPSATGSTVCGTGNTSSIVLALTGYDATTANATEVKTSAVSASAGTVGSYTYTSSSHSVSLGTYTSPATGPVTFSVTVTAPDGNVNTLTTSGVSVVGIPTGFTATAIAGSTYTVVDSNAINVSYALSGTGSLTGFATGNPVSSVITTIAGSGLTFGTIGNFTAQGSFTLGTTYSGSTGPVTATLIMAQTRARIALTMQGYKFPTTVSFSQPTLAVGTATSITATTDTVIAAGTAYSVTTSSGTVTSGSGTTASETSQVAFTFTPSATAATGTLQMTFATIARSLSASLPAVLGVTQTSLESASMNVGTALAAQTLTLSGSGTGTLVAANIAVFLNNSSTQVNNCTVSAYDQGTGVVTFTVTPSVSGMNTLYVKVTSTPVVSYRGSSGLGFFVDYADIASATQSSVLSTSGCSLWYDGSDPNGTGVAPATNTSISTWSDKSGNARHATSSTTPKAAFVAGVVGTRGCVRFTGGSLAQYDAPSTYTLVNTGPWTIFVVMNASQSTSGIVVGTGTGINPWDFFIGAYSGKFFYQFGGNYGYQLPGMATTSNWVIGSVVTPTGSTNGPTSTYTNGVWQETVLCPNVTKAVNIAIGWSNASYNTGGDVAEVIVYNRPLSGLERRTIERYLSGKWSVPVSGITCTMPSAATITCMTLSYTSKLCRVTVAVTGGTLKGASFTVYYGAAAGATSASGLTQLGSSSFTSFRDSTCDVTVPTTPMYLYVKITSPFGTDGAFFGNAAPFTVGPVVLPTSFTYTTTPVYPTSSFLIRTIVVSPISDLPLTCYYASTAGLTQVSQLTPLVTPGVTTTLNADGQANIYGFTLPVGIVYLYVQITDPDGVVSGVIGNATPITISDYVPPTSFTFTVPTTQTSVGIARTTGTNLVIPTEVYFGTTLGTTSIAGLTKFGSGSWGTYSTKTFSSTGGTPFPYNTTLYLYVRCPSTSASVLGNASPIWISSLYQQPTSFTFTVPTTQTSVGIKRTTGTSTSIPTEVYYGTAAGITSIASLTKFGSGSWAKTTATTFTSTGGTQFPTETALYLYVRCPSTSGAVLGNATSFRL